MKSCLLALSFLCLAGCVSFTHQVPVSDPHALLTVIPSRIHQDEDARRVVRIDGQSVLSRRVPHTYRLAPGEHTVMIENQVTVTRTNPYAGVQAILWLAGCFAMQASGETAYGGGPVTTYQEILHASVTNTVTVEAGHSYILDACSAIDQTDGQNKAVGSGVR